MAGDLDDMLARLPSWHPPLAVLELAELVVAGVLPALPVPLPVPDDVRARALAEGGLVLEDAEGTPVASLTGLSEVRGTAETGAATLPGVTASDGPASSALTGTPAPVRPFTHGPLRRFRAAPAQVAERLAEAGAQRAFAVAVDGALTTAQVEDLAALAAMERAGLVWLVLVGAGRRRDLPAEALMRAVRDAAADADAAGAPGVVVAVAAPRLPDQRADGAMLTAIADGFGARALLPLTLPGVGTASWHAASARELARSLRPPHERGVTLFFTGLSGSGKSTVAKALADRLLDDGRRDLTMLDGDEVRRLLSAGLGFGRADRDLNIRRIGYVAAEVTRHGGVAICAPIAPFASVRDEVAAMVSDVGDFVLVHVSTPLAECERRDRKGLYAKARQGLIPEFTGISSPYEEPEDPALRLDTSRMSVSEAVQTVWDLLERRGYLGPPEEGGAPGPVVAVAEETRLEAEGQEVSS